MLHPNDLPGVDVAKRSRAEALDLFAVISVQLATLSEQLRPLARLYAARPLSVSCGILLRPTHLHSTRTSLDPCRAEGRTSSHSAFVLARASCPVTNGRAIDCCLYCCSSSQGLASCALRLAVVPVLTRRV